jgi:cobalamin biosynthesis protein CobD/CbiB
MSYRQPSPFELVVGALLGVLIVLVFALLPYLAATSLTTPLAIVIAALLVSAAVLAKNSG